MKRIVVLIDGTWDKEGASGDTNVAKLDSGQRMPGNAFIKAVATDGAVQNVHYHDGVGTEGNTLSQGAWSGLWVWSQEDHQGCLRVCSR